MIIEAQIVHTLYRTAAGTQQIGMGLLRVALVIVLVWIGSLKFVDYEAEGIVPLVANSTIMSFFYHYPAPDYQTHMSKEGERNAAHKEWHRANGTYRFSRGLGVVIILIGLLVALNPVIPQVGAAGSFLLVLMACTTLSFLATTPEAWVPALGETAHGFPYLSGTGRLIIKDVIMLGAAIVTMADSTSVYLKQVK